MGQIAQKRNKNVLSRFESEIMTTAMVIDDLDDHVLTNERKMDGNRSGLNRDPLKWLQGQGRHQGDAGATAMAGTPLEDRGTSPRTSRDATATRK